MIVVSPHEISQINYLNFDTYIAIECDPWQRYCILMLDVCSLFECPKVALNFSRNVSKLLSKGDWHCNKVANQTKVVLDNKMWMSPTWVRPIGYRWKWSQITKCTWLTKLRNFEHVPSNFLGRLIHGSFSWGYVVEMHLKKVKAWLVYKWAIDSRNAWFSYSRFLKITRNFSIDVNIILKQKDNKK